MRYGTENDNLMFECYENMSNKHIVFNSISADTNVLLWLRFLFLRKFQMQNLSAEIERTFNTIWLMIKRYLIAFYFYLFSVSFSNKSRTDDVNVTHVSLIVCSTLANSGSISFSKLYLWWYGRLVIANWKWIWLG